MCIPNINATIRCFSGVDESNMNIGTNMLEKIKCKSNNSGKYIDDFIINVLFCFMSSGEKNKDSNVLNSNGEIFMELRLTKPDEDGAISKVLIDFNFPMPKDEVLSFANVNLNVRCDNKIYLPDNDYLGEYVIELILKRKINNKFIEENWVVQSCYPIEITE